jgi:hypothetical protein
VAVGTVVVVIGATVVGVTAPVVGGALVVDVEVNVAGEMAFVAEPLQLTSASTNTTPDSPATNVNAGVDSLASPSVALIHPPLPSSPESS